MAGGAAMYRRWRDEQLPAELESMGRLLDFLNRQPPVASLIRGPRQSVPRGTMSRKGDDRMEYTIRDINRANWQLFRAAALLEGLSAKAKMNQIIDDIAAKVNPARRAKKGTGRR